MVPVEPVTDNEAFDPEQIVAVPEAVPATGTASTLVATDSEVTEEQSP